MSNHKRRRYPNVMDRKLKLDLRTSVTTLLGA